MHEMPLPLRKEPQGSRLPAWLQERQRWYTLAVAAAALAVGLVVAYGSVRLFPYELNPSVITEPYLIRKGFLIYENLGGQKAPLLLLFVAWLLPIFHGDAVLAVRLTHAAFATFIVAGFLFWTYRNSGQWALLASAAFFLAWSNLYGYWALLYYDFFLVPIYFAALLFFTQPPHRLGGWVFGLFGLANGIALLAKQHTVTLAVLVLAYLAWQAHSRVFSRRTALRFGLIYLVCLSLPMAIYLGMYFLRTGSISEVVYWLVWSNLNGKYATMAAKLPQPAELVALLPTLVLFVPYLYSLVRPATNQQPDRSTRLWLLALAALALIYVYPRWSTRHLTVALPFFAVISGIGFADLVQGRLGRSNIRLALRLLGFLLVGYWFFHAADQYVRASRLDQPEIYPGYTDVAELALKLHDRIPSEGTLVLLPSDEANTNLYYLLQREPPPLLFPNLPWYIEEGLEERWLHAIQSEPPAAVIYFPGRWNIEKYAPRLLAYFRQNYQVTSDFHWKGNRVKVLTPLR